VHARINLVGAYLACLEYLSAVLPDLSLLWKIPCISFCSSSPNVAQKNKALANMSKKILVVDDSSNERNGLCRLLERAGYEVRSAADGVEALQKVRSGKFDLLLVDIWMPRMNGVELLALLPEDPRPKALIITGEESPEILLRSLRAKAYLFIAKPVDPSELLQVIKDTLETPPGPDPIQVVSAKPNWVELRFPCALQIASRIENVIDQLNCTLPAKIRQAVGMALHELLMNAIEWGGRLNPEARAQIDYLRTRKFVMCRIADPGKGFDPGAGDFEAITVRSREPLAHGAIREEKGLRPGGYGIQFAKSLVDELVYNEAHNEVTIVKYLN
jgi:CheY-like chemotaxis protein/anti-sigma regulatory factor (Ser/Thr protein kinase)